MIIDEWFAGAALGRLAGVAGAVGLLELPDVVVRGRQVVVPAVGGLLVVTRPGLICPVGLTRHLATITLVIHASTH